MNENSESFNFGYLNGVRGFYTNPSRADDCFIPFKSVSTTSMKIGSATSSSTIPTNATNSYYCYNDLGIYKYLVITDWTVAKPTLNFDDVKQPSINKGELIDISNTKKIRIGQSGNTATTNVALNMSWDGYLLVDDIIPSE